MPPRTSESHPLDVRWLDCLGGPLGLTFCPGKVGDSIHGSPWRRDLDTDLGALRAAGAGALVTLMEEHELAAMKVAELGRCAEALGLEWMHLPIVDVDVPGDAFEGLWPVWLELIRARLADGGRVVLHCRGGLGRTGTIAARLLVEDGMAPGAAIAAVRAVRPGAVETPAQEAHVRSARPGPGDPAWRRRVAGCLLGGAIGDAFGYAIEFDKLAEIRRRHGPEGLREPVFEHGRLVVSDDTQMTLFTAVGILDALESGGGTDAAILGAVRAATLDWYCTQTGGRAEPADRAGLLGFAELWARRAPGNTCLSACASGAPGTPESPVNGSKGCGGVMRTAPFGLIPGIPPARAFELAARAAAQTHGHPSGSLSAGAMAAMVRLLLDGVPLDRAAAGARDLAAGWQGAGETVAALDAALAASPGRQGVASLGEGWVGEEALAIGLYAALHARDFREAVAIAANHDGDSDSTASIAGQLWGAAHGPIGIPAAWLRPLDVLRPLGAVLGRWFAVAGRATAA